jgi:simple sugar transport system permease protein
MVEPGLVATGLTGAWVNTVRGLIFLIAIIFYLFVEEPHRRRDFFARFRRAQAFGQIRSVE